MEEGTFGLGFEGCIGSLYMELEDVHGGDSSEGGGLEEELWGRLRGLDTGRYIRPDRGDSSRRAISGLSSWAPAPRSDCRRWAVGGPTGQGSRHVCCPVFPVFQGLVRGSRCTCIRSSSWWSLEGQS